MPKRTPTKGDNLVPDDHIVRFLRRQEEAKNVIEGVRGAALLLNAATEAAAKIGLAVEIKVMPRRDPELGARYATVVPAIFVEHGR